MSIMEMPREPMLAQPVDTFHLPAGWAAEPKWDGFRALLAHGQEQTLLRSRHGTDLTGAFHDWSPRPPSCRTTSSWTAKWSSGPTGASLSNTSPGG
ncbi:hypothetical protein [Streptomyces ochraceiscleroticus]|uniref:hypothetical protein n=1 Tax=Streptomyces ochraceiscleroticus TaxID=47761 RepID=UPI000690A389|nr:hypothetical protein [Streptomyces ochraceiscleroticus]